MTPTPGEERVQEIERRYPSNSVARRLEVQAPDHMWAADIRYLITRLREVEGERDRARSHSYQFPNIHSEPADCETWWDGCCCFEEEMARLKGLLAQAEQRVAVAYDAIRRLCSGDYSANDVADWLALTQPPPAQDKYI